MSNERDGFRWSVVQKNAYGNVRALERSQRFDTADEAAAGPFTLDGRVLDPAAYVVVILLD